MFHDDSLVIRSHLSNGKGMSQYPVTGAYADAPGGRRQKITTAGPDKFREIVYDIDFRNQTYIPTEDGAMIEHWGYRLFEIVGGNTAVNTLKFTPRSNVIYLDDIEISELSADSTEWNFENENPYRGLYGDFGGASVITEEDGNRVLKVSSPTTLRFRSPDTTTKKAMVSYKIKVLTAATNLGNTTHQQFGAARNDVSTAVHTAHYQSYGILAWKGAENSNRTMFKFNDCAGDGIYHTIKYLLDFDTHTYSVYVDGVLHSELSDSAFRDNTVDSINQLYFFVNSGDTFCLDDVKIKEIPPIGSWNFEESDTFADYSGIQTGETAEIIKDTEQGNVLKVTGGASLRFNVPATVSNKVEVRYKIRGAFAKQSGVRSFGSVCSGSSETVKIAKYQEGITNFNGSGNNYYLLLSDLTEWKDVLLVLDMDNKTYRTWVDGVLKPYHANAQNYDKAFYDKTGTSVDNIYFDIAAENTLYIDDVSIKDITLNPAKTVYENVNPKEPLPVSFDNNICYESLLGNKHFKLFAGDTEVTDFTVARTAENTVSLMPENGFAYDTTYTFTVLKTVNSETPGFTRAKEDIQITIHTESASDIAPKVIKTFPENGETCGLISPVITFENPVSENAVSVVVTDEANKNVQAEWSILHANCAFPKAVITIPDMQYGKTYHVAVTADSGTENFSFRTSQVMAENAVAVTNGTDGKVKVSAFLLNNTDTSLPCTFLTALYKGKEMIAAQSVYDTIPANGKIQKALYLPEPDDFGTDYNMKLFVWNSLSSAAPFMLPVSITEQAGFDDYTYWTKEDLSVWKDAYDAKITDNGINGFTIGAIADVQRDDLTGFGSNLHHHGLLADSVNLIGNVDCVADLGDTIGGNHPDKAGTMQKLSKQTAIMQETGVPVFRVIGNHDDNQGGVLASKSMDSFLYADDWTSACNAAWETDMDGSTAGKKSYYYKDFEKDKIRVIALNSSDVTWDYTGQTNCYFAFGFRQEQMTWLANEALNFSSKGDDKTNWGVVFLMHVGVWDGGGIYNFSGVSEIITAFQNGTAGVINKTNDRTDMSIYGLKYDFTGQGKMETICTLDGHTHYDQYVTWSNMPKITVTSSNRVNGNKEDIGIDIITIDRKNRKIYATRLGQGEDREWTY